MRIAVDIRHLATPVHTGVAQYTVHLLHHLIPLMSTHEFFLVSAGKSSLQASIPSFPYKNCHAIHLRLSNRWVAFQTLCNPFFTLEKYLPQKPDLWFFPNINFIRTDIPYFLTAHDISFSFFPEFFTRKQKLWHALAKPKRLFLEATGIFSVSERTKSDLHAHFAIEERKITVTPLGIIPIFSPRERPEDRGILRRLRLPKRYFLTLSSLEPRKNLSRLIAAYSHFRKNTKEKNPPSLVLAGSAGWKKQAILQAAKTSPFSTDIHFLSSFDEYMKPAIYRHAEAFFFPSLYEGFGLPPLEALACGVPVIASQTGALAEILGKDAFLINPLHVHDLALAMEEILHPEVRDFFTRNAAQKASSFSFADTAQKTAQALQRALDVS